MAIDQENVAINIAKKTITATEALLDAIVKLQALESQRAAAGVTLTNFDDAYTENGGTKHVDGATLNLVLNNSVPAIWTFMTTNNHDDNLQKLRP